MRALDLEQRRPSLQVRSGALALQAQGSAAVYPTERILAVQGGVDVSDSQTACRGEAAFADARDDCQLVRAESTGLVSGSDSRT